MEFSRSSLLLACLGLSLPGLATAQSENSHGRILEQTQAQALPDSK